MHDIRLIRDNPAAFDAGLQSRGLEPLSADLIALDERRRAAVSALQVAQESRNSLSKEIGQAKKARDEARAAGLMEEVARLKSYVPELEETERAAKAELETKLAEIPNLPGPDVPFGQDEHGNVQREDHRYEGNRQLGSGKQHFELGEAWTIGGAPLMDFEAAAKLSGSRFVVLRGQLARLERALGQFMLDLHTTEHGYTEVSPPLMVRRQPMFGTAQLPKFADDQFYALSSLDPENLKAQVADVLDQSMERVRSENAVGENDLRMIQFINGFIDQAGSSEDHVSTKRYVEQALSTLVRNRRELASERLKAAEYLGALASRLWLIPTAEVPLTNLVRESILSEDELPLRFTALTPCFRAEAGAAGRDTRGMLRQHQFTKCELVSITTPDQSAQEHERMLACAEEVLKRLDLPFRVMILCTGDMGFASRKTYDIEVWMPGQGTYREISSCSVCGDFQARRMEARYRPKPEGGGKPASPRHVHTLNGSGVAVGRALIAVLENYQEPDGTVTVPSALRPYMGGLERIGGNP